MKITINVEGATEEQLRLYTEIITVLISKGALDGVRGGQAIIHFGSEGEFMGVQLSYWPWRKRRI